MKSSSDHNDPEQNPRERIDPQLELAGWIVLDYRQMNISAGLWIAVREFPLTTGRMLYIDGKAIGIVEPKPKSRTEEAWADEVHHACNDQQKR